MILVIIAIQNKACQGTMLALKQTGYALVAQLDRVLASEAKGRGFDSRRARHFALNHRRWLGYSQ